MSEQDLSTEEVEAPSMDDTIRSTLEEIQNRDNEIEDHAVEDPKVEKTRDENGRFAAKVEDDHEESTVETKDPETSTAPVVPPELQKLGLRKDEAEAFAQATPAVQAAFIRRSEEMHRGFEQHREKAQFGDAMIQVMQPHMQTFQQLGVQPSEAVGKLLQADHALRYGSPAQKTQFLTQIARDYGVDLGQAQEFAASQPQQNPEVDMLRNQVAQMNNWIEQNKQAQEWQQREALNSEIQQFASKPESKFFEEVRSEMAGLLQAGLAPNLEKAYEMAIYANPVVRAKVIAEQQATAEQNRIAEANRKAKDARQAAAVNVSRKGTLPASKPIGTMDDTIRETAARLGLIS